MHSEQVAGTAPDDPVTVAEFHPPVGCQHMRPPDVAVVAVGCPDIMLAFASELAQ